MYPILRSTNLARALAFFTLSAGPGPIGPEFNARTPTSSVEPHCSAASLCALLSLYPIRPGLSASSAADMPKAVSRYSPCAVRLGLG
jgi:hypothetical protein